MSINDIKSRASTALPSLHVALGAPETDTKLPPAPGVNSTLRNMLPGRAPPQAGVAATSPRVALAMLGSTRPDAARAITVKVLSDIDNGKLVLSASHSTVTLTAAIGIAARGLMALRNAL